MPCPSAHLAEDGDGQTRITGYMYTSKGGMAGHVSDAYVLIIAGPKGNPTQAVNGWEKYSNLCLT